MGERAGGRYVKVGNAVGTTTASIGVIAPGRSTAIIAIGAGV